MKKIFLFLLLLLTSNFLLSTRKCFAQPNIFGLHLTQTADINSAAPIINSSGGDWGWTTVVIRLDQLDHNTWQDFFDNCRKYHIIPIIRLATIMDQGYWKKPETSDIDNLANFLNSLNWPSIPQYIILFNEINHSTEWGGTIDAKSYTDIAIYAAQKFKSVNSNFFILGGSLDLAAATSKKSGTASAADIYQEIYAYKPEYFNLVDGLASHSYPNHGYVGTPNDTGQHSIRGYQWELNFIKSLGVSKTYPVFITETGWPHREGEAKNNSYYTTQTSAKFLIQALNIWSEDSRIKAVTPFIYNYPNTPFDHFSWLDASEKLYPEYQPLIALPKSKNTPIQITKYATVSNHLPFLILTNNDYVGQITLKNTGQSVWGETNFCLNPQTTQNVVLDAICTSNNYIYPGQTETFNYQIKIKNMPDYKDKTFISWENVDTFEITPINGAGTIYHPNTSLKAGIIQFFHDLFI
jgi:hypothetical protein